MNWAQRSSYPCAEKWKRTANIFLRGKLIVADPQDQIIGLALRCWKPLTKPKALNVIGRDQRRFVFGALRSPDVVAHESPAVNSSVQLGLQFGHERTGEIELSTSWTIETLI